MLCTQRQTSEARTDRINLPPRSNCGAGNTYVGHKTRTPLSGLVQVTQPVRPSGLYVTQPSLGSVVRSHRWTTPYTSPYLPILPHCWYTQTPHIVQTQLINSTNHKMRNTNNTTLCELGSYIHRANTNRTLCKYGQYMGTHALHGANTNLYNLYNV